MAARVQISLTPPKIHHLTSDAGMMDFLFYGSFRLPHIMIPKGPPGHAEERLLRRALSAVAARDSLSADPPKKGTAAFLFFFPRPRAESAESGKNEDSKEIEGFADTSNKRVKCLQISEFSLIFCATLM